MTKRKTKTEPKWYQVAIDYRSAGYPGCCTNHVKAESSEAAIAAATALLRAEKINLTIGNAIAQLSGWSR